MALFFTSDTHFGHAAIIDICNRPFATVEEMDEAMIANWNDVVAPEDTVYHLGDVAYRNERRTADYIDRLNGTIHLIVGNHDEQTIEMDRDAFASVHDIMDFKLDDRRMVLCHYPMREWHGSWKGAWHLFGHVHGRLDHLPLGYSLDVGVDSHNFRPWSLSDIADVFATRENPFAGERQKPV